MSTGVFPVIQSTLDAPALVERVLAGYDLPHPPRCRLTTQSLNDTYQVTAGTTIAYLRVSPAGWRTAAEIEAELDVLTFFAERRIGVARAVARKDGVRVVPIQAPEGVRHAVLFPSVGEHGVRDITTDHARAYGRLAAHLHAAADTGGLAGGNGFPPAPRRLDVAHLLDEPLASIKTLLGHHTAEFAALEAVADRVRSHLLRLPWTHPAVGFCHGDLHPGNVRFSATGEPVLFDFDCWGEGWRAYDLAVFLWNGTLEKRPKTWSQGRWRAFLRGYRSVRPFGEAELATVPLFLVARHIWLMGLDCAARTDFRPQWLNEGYLREQNRHVAGWVAAYPILQP